MTGGDGQAVGSAGVIGGDSSSGKKLRSSGIQVWMMFSWCVAEQ